MCVEEEENLDLGLKDLAQRAGIVSVVAVRGAEKL